MPEGIFFLTFSGKYGKIMLERDDIMDIVFGGSFNPPTVAHFRIAKKVMSAYPSAAFYFLPTGQAYWKEGLIEDRHRLSMLELLCRRLGPRAAVSDIEIKDKNTPELIIRFASSMIPFSCSAPIISSASKHGLTFPRWRRKTDLSLSPAPASISRRFSRAIL